MYSRLSGFDRLPLPNCSQPGQWNDGTACSHPDSDELAAREIKREEQRLEDYEINSLDRSLPRAHSSPNIKQRIKTVRLIVIAFGAANIPQSPPAITTNGRINVNGPKMSVLVILRISTEGNARTKNVITRMSA